MKSGQFKIIGMTCEGCATAVSRAVKEMGGVRASVASFEKGEATVQYDEHITDADKIMLAIMSAGYSAIPINAMDTGGHEIDKKDTAAIDCRSVSY